MPITTKRRSWLLVEWTTFNKTLKHVKGPIYAKQIFEKCDITDQLKATFVNTLLQCG